MFRLLSIFVISKISLSMLSSFKSFRLKNTSFKNVSSSVYKKKFYKLLLCLFTLNFLSACATGLVSEKRQRAQAVFLYHNQLVSELILVSSDASLSDTQLVELEQAEASMVKACKPLNQVAADVRDGDKSGLGKRLRISATLTECERQTKLVEQLLAKL